MKKIMMAVLSTAVVQGFAHADDASFSVSVARVQVGLKCTLSQANGGDTDCTIQVKSRGKQDVVLALDAATGAYSGVDVVDMDGSQDILALGADVNKTLSSLSLMHMSQSADGSSFGVNLSAVETSSLASVNIPKMNITVNADQSVSVDLAMVAYAPADGLNMVTSFNPKALQDFALKTIQPAIQVARFKAK